MSLEYTHFYHLKYHMNFFLHRTQYNIDVDDEIENEDSLIPIDGAKQFGEEEEQTGSELSINTERASKKCRKDFNKFQKGDKEGVDKILTFLKEKNKIRNSQESLTSSLQVHVKALSASPAIYN